MVASITGTTLGLATSSARVLGAAGQVGSASLGRGPTRVAVNAATGNLVLSSIDDSLVGLGLDVSLDRTYNSLSGTSEKTGGNWRFGVARKVFGLAGTLNTAGSTVWRMGEDGAEAQYTYDTGLARYVSTAGDGSFDTLTLDGATNRWVWTDGDTRAVERYDNANSGRLVEAVDSDGNKLSVFYNANGLANRIATQNGENLYIDYDTTAGRTSNVTQVRTVTSGGATVTRVRYVYDTANRLSSVAVDLTPADNVVADGKTFTTTYSYVDATSRLVSSVSQSDGTRVDFTYELVAGAQRIKTVRDVPLNRTTTYTYDTVNRKTTIADPLGRVTELSYDASNNLIGLKLPVVGTNPAQALSFGYDASGNLVSTVDARGNATTYGYDTRGNRTFERNALGNTVERVFSTTNKLLNEISYLVPDPDGAGAALPSTPVVTRYVYDTGNRLRYVVSADGLVTEYVYNASGQRTAALAYAGLRYDVSALAAPATIAEATLNTWVATASRGTIARTEYAYDVRGQLASVTQFTRVDASGNGVADGTQAITRYVYSAAGELLQVIDEARGAELTDTDTAWALAYRGALGYVNTTNGQPKTAAQLTAAEKTALRGKLSRVYTYDGLGRELSQTSADGVVTSLYDDANRKLTITSAGGLALTRLYDQAGSLVSESQTAGGVTLPAKTYVYDDAGMMRMATDALGNQTLYLFDEAQRQVGEIDATGMLTEYIYTASNQLSRTIRYANQVAAAALSTARGAPKTATLAALRPAASALSDRHEFRIYDAAGRIVKTVDAVGAVVDFSYDGANRLVAKTGYANLLTTAIFTALRGLTREPLPADAVASTSALNDRVQRKFYDGDGRLLAELDGEGFLREYGYDGAGRLVKTTAYANATPVAQRASGTLAQLRPATNAADIVGYNLYNGKGQLEGIVDGEGYLTEFSYDLSGNRSAVKRYLTKVTYSAGATVATLRPAAQAEDQATAFAYDAMNRLWRQTLPGGVLRQYTYDADGRLRVVTQSAADGSLARTSETIYDGFGRVSAELLGEEKGKYDTEWATRSVGMTAAQLAALRTELLNKYATQYAYDSGGRRISSTDPNGRRTLYFYDDEDRLVATINHLGEVVRNALTVFGEVSQRRGVTKRLDGTTLAGMSGGKLTLANFSALNALNDDTADRVDSFTYTRRSELRTSNAALAQTNDRLFSYNAFGQIESDQRNFDGTNSRNDDWQYDRRGVLTRSRVDTGGLLLATSYALDAFGRRTQVTDPNGKLWKTNYDRLGRVVETIDPNSVSRRSTYDAHARVLTLVDGTGQTTTFSYDSANRRLTTTTAEGIVTTRTRNVHGEEVSIVDGRGNTSSFSYDRSGRLTGVTTPAGTTSNTFDNAGLVVETRDQAGVRTTYTYDAANRELTRTVDTGGLNLVSSFRYDGQGRQVWSQDATGVWTNTIFNPKGQVTAVVVDPKRGPDWVTGSADDNPGGLALRTEYTYDWQARMLSVTQGAGSAQPQRINYEYDKADRRTAEVRDPSGLALRTTYAYDKNGNVSKRTDATGAVTRFAYDAANRVAYTVDATGAVEYSEYDAEGRRIRSTRYANRIATGTLPEPVTTAAVAALIVANANADEVQRFVYDRDGRLAYSVDALNYVVANQFDGNGNVVAQTRTSRAITLPGTMTTANMATAVAAVADAANDRTTRNVYDAANRAVYTIDAAGYVTQRSFDALGRVTKTVAYANVVSIAGNPTVAQVAAVVTVNATFDRTNRAYFDAAGRLRVEVDALGYAIERRYDATGRQLKAIRYPAAIAPTDASTLANVIAMLPVSVPATAAVAETRYDRAGRAYEIVDGEGVVTRRTFDAAGRTTDVYDAYGTGLQRQTHRVLDGAGRIVEETIAYGTSDAVTRRYTYDGADRRIKDIDPRGIELAEKDTAWALEQRGGRTAASLTAAEKQAYLDQYTTTRAYDGLGRQTQVIDPLGGVALTGYDAFGNAVKVTDPNGNVGYFYFDRLNRVTLQVDPEGYVTQTRYTGFGKADQVTRYANVAVGTWNEGTPPAIAATAPGSGPYVLTNATGDQLTQLQYDRFDRLTRSTDAEGFFETYAYDAFGNRTGFTNKVGGVFTYEYDRRGALVKETLPIQSRNAGGTLVAVVNRYVYDSRGNRTRTIEAEGLPEQRTTDFEYDRLDRQVRRLGQAVSTYVVGAGAGSAQPIERTVYDARGNVIERWDANGNRLVSYYNALDRKVAEVSPVGAFSTYRFDAAGNVIAQRSYGDLLTLPVGSTVPTPVNAANYRETLLRYDANNRETESKIGYDARATNGTRGVYTAVLNILGDGTAEVAVSQYHLFTRKQYDRNGNITRVQRGRIDVTGGTPLEFVDATSYAFYDRLGRKVLEIDPELYGAAWSYDTSGSVVQESRLYNRYTGTITGQTATAILAAWTRDGTRDRITQYGYDRNNRLVRESRLNVAYGSVSGTGVLTETTGTATNNYSYSGLGKRTRLVDANGNQTDWTYDVAGRLTQELRPQATDYVGTSWRSATDYEYNGLNLVTREVRRGKDAAVETDDRIVRYEYGTGGRLSASVDARGLRHDYSYDLAGNRTRDAFARADADGVSSADADEVQYDAAYREIKRYVRSGATTGTVRETRYNAFGEITGKRTNGGNLAGAWQETADYDPTGHAWRANSGNGATKSYIYDSLGNAVIAVESAGSADLGALSFEQLLAKRAANNRNDANGAIDGVFETFTVYDKRGSVKEIVQPSMVQSSGTVSSAQFQTVAVALYGGQSSAAIAPRTLPAAPTGQVSPLGKIGDTGSTTAASSVNWSHAEYTVGDEYSSTLITQVTLGSIALSFPAMNQHWATGGTDYVRIQVSGSINGQAFGAADQWLGAGATSTTVGLNQAYNFSPSENVDLSYTVTISYRPQGGGDLRVVQLSKTTRLATGNGTTWGFAAASAANLSGVATAVTNTLFFRPSSGAPDAATLMYKRAGDPNYASVAMTRMSGAPAGWFSINYANLLGGSWPGTWDMRVIATTGGTIVTHVTKTLVLNGGDTPTNETGVAQQYLDGTLIGAGTVNPSPLPRIGDTGTQGYSTGVNIAGSVDYGESGPVSISAWMPNIDVSFPTMAAHWSNGAGDLVRVTITGSLGGVAFANTLHYAPGTTYASVPLNFSYTYSYAQDVDLSYTVSVDYIPQGGAARNIVSTSRTARFYSANTGVFADATSFNTSGAAASSRKIFFRSPEGASSGVLYWKRPTDAVWQGLYLGNPTGAPPIYEFDYNYYLGSGALGDWDFRFVGLNGSGNVVNHAIRRLTLNGADTATDQTNVNAMWLDGIGEQFFQAGNYSTFFDLGGYATGSTIYQSATSFVVRYRPQGSTGAWTTGTASGNAGIPGYMAWNYGALAGNYEVRIDNYVGATYLGSAIAVYTLGATPAVVQKHKPYADGSFRVTGDSSVAKATLWYRRAGSTGAYTSVHLAAPTGGATSPYFDFDTAALVDSPFGNTDYEYVYETYNSAMTVLNRVGGTFRVGASPAVLTHVVQRQPSVIDFKPSYGNSSTKLRLSYSGATGSGSLDIGWNGSGYRWDASALAPATGSVDVSYTYQLIDIATGTVRNDEFGQPLVVNGTARLGDNVTSTSPNQVWVTSVPLSSNLAVRRKQEVNAFGEVISETDGNGNRTDLEYNTLGKLTRKTDPTVSVTLVNGFVKNGVRPVTNYSYDRLGQLVASTDANGFRRTQTWSNAWGEAKVLKEFHPDGGIAENRYDVFGDKRTAIDELGRATSYTYDANSQLTRIDRPNIVNPIAGDTVASWDAFEYDILGQRVGHSNAAGRERTYFDGDSRVVRTVSGAGRQVTTSYAWDATITGVGGRQVGGFVRTTVDGKAQANTMVDKLDVFGRLSQHTDLSGRNFVYAYNNAGWLTSQTGTNNGQNLQYLYYANGYAKRVTDVANNLVSEFQYDRNGNRVYERYAKADGSATYQLTRLSYDGLNRLARVDDPLYDVRYEYDAVGNRRRVYSKYQNLIDNTPNIQDYWYKYDTMNRFTVTRGVLSTGAPATTEGGAGTVVEGASGAGVSISYNAASERIGATYASDRHSERYTYNGAGYLKQVDTQANGSPTWIVLNQRDYDGPGRVVRSKDFDPTTGALKDKGYRLKTWDADNKALTDKDASTGRGSTFSYYGDGTLFRNDDDTAGTANRTTTEYSYQWWDGAAQSEIKIVWQYGAAANQFVDGFSKFEYDINGRLYRMFNPTAGKQQMYQYLSDASGQILERKEYGGPGSTLRYDVATGTVLQADNPVWVRYYYADGHRIGEVNNTGAPLEQQDYAQEMARAPAKGNDAKHKLDGPQMWADFDQNYQPINSGYPSAAASSYLVRKGDTLRSIAQAVWGDANLWYLIAEANGLVGSESPTEGMTLWIPNKVVNIHNDSGTYKVYDPGEAIGNTSPLLPDPPAPSQKKKCGGLGLLIAVVVAVVVTVITAGAAAVAMGAATGSLWGAGTAALAGSLTGGALGAATGFAAAAIGGAVGSIASQGVLIAAGMQDSFSWKGVALGAVGAAVGAGIGAAASTPGSALSSLSGTGLGATVGRAVLGNVLTQGIGVATGLQKKFDWRGVAASAVASGVGWGVGELIGRAQYGERWSSTDPKVQAGLAADVKTDWGNTLVRAVGSGIAAGAASSLVRSGRVNWGNVVQDAVGSAVGNLITEQLKFSDERVAAEQERQLQAREDARDAAMASLLGQRPGAREVAQLLARFEAASRLGAGGTSPSNEVFDDGASLARAQWEDAMAQAYGAGVVRNAVYRPGEDDATAQQVGWFKDRLDDAKAMIRSFEEGVPDLLNKIGPRTASGTGFVNGLVNSVANGVEGFVELVAMAGPALAQAAGLKTEAGEKATEFFASMVDGLKALASDPVGVIGKAYGAKLEAAQKLYDEGKYFQAASIHGEIVGDLLQVAAGGYGLAKTGVGLTQTVARSLMGELKVTAAVGATVNAELAAAGLKNVSDAQRAILVAAVRDSGRLSEAKGVVYGFQRMREAGFELRPEMLKYGSNNGLDMIFQNTKTGEFAILEAKHGEGLGSLKTYSGLRQGSEGYNLDRLSKYIDAGGEHVEFARQLRTSLIDGKVESYASFYRGDTLVKFDLSHYKTTANFVKKPETYSIVPHR